MSGCAVRKYEYLAN